MPNFLVGIEKGMSIMVEAGTRAEAEKLAPAKWAEMKNKKKLRENRYEIKDQNAQGQNDNDQGDNGGTTPPKKGDEQ